MKYLDTKKSSLEDSVIGVWREAAKKMDEKLVGGQKKLDKDKDGDIDGKDFAMLRKSAAKKKNVKEGTWAMPDTPKLKMGLKKALQRPIMLGKEGDDATDTIRNFIGDDELYDDLYSAGMKNPKADARPIIKAAMKRLGIKEDVELDENLKAIEKMMKDRKYKGKTSAFDAAVKKMFPKEYEKDDVQDLIKKHAEMNEQSLDENFRKLAMMGIGTETKKGAKVGQTTDYYLPKTGDKSTGKIMRVSKDGYEIKNDGDLTPSLKGKIHKFKFYDPMNDKTSVRGMKNRPRGYASDAERRSEYGENYEIGNDYAKHTLEVTPGQDKKDVDEMLGIMHKKSTSMREALAKVWGIDEGKSPFQKKEEMKKEKPLKKTMTGKEPTAVEVNPELKP